jgi:alpha-ketoglutarate-dependent 2,4-dichlorophenoxyacetate dioxygenase
MAAMRITVQPVTPAFVAEVGDVDLSKPLSAEDEAAIKQAFWTYAVLIFPQQTLDEDSLLAFARRFGPLETSIRAYRPDEKTRLKRPEMSDISNMDDKGEIWSADNRVRQYKAGNRLWHTDSSFKYVPARASLLYAKAIPPLGGHTEFADTRAAYDALPDDMKARLEGLVAEHSLFNSRARIGFGNWNEMERQKLEVVPQAMVRTHPESGRRHLYVASHAGRVLGMPEAEGRALIDQLLAHASQRQFVYTHRWRVGDLVMWDDRCTLHRGTDYDDLRHKRDMMRATVSDEVNSAEREGLQVDAA